MSDLRIPVLAWKQSTAWPKNQKGREALYLSPAEAFTRRFKTDAHFAAYSVPGIARRLADASAIEQLAAGGGIPLVLFILDVDAPAHGAAGPEAVEAWFGGEREKLANLDAAHPGAFRYRTRGGFRLAYQLTAPFVLLTAADAATWKNRYLRSLCYLARAFGLAGDPLCADWTRLYRLPLVVREGEGEGKGEEQIVTYETAGDPGALGAWSRVPSDTDLEADTATARELAATEPKVKGESRGPWSAFVKRLAGEGSQGGAVPAPSPPRPAPSPRPRGLGRPPLEEREQLDGRKALDRVCRELGAMAPNTARNIRLNNIAAEMGHYVPHILSEAEVTDRLREAARACRLDAGEIDPTIRSGLGKGKSEPQWPRDRPSWKDEERTAAGRAPRITDDGEVLSEDTTMAKPANDTQNPGKPANDPPDDIGDMFTSSESTPPPSGEQRQEERRSADRRTAAALPRIDVTHKIADVIDASGAALAAAPSLNLFVRDQGLVQILRSKDKDKGRRDFGSPIVRRITPATLLEQLTRVAEFQRYDRRAKEIVNVVPNGNVVQGLYDRGVWPGMRPLIGILETPFLRPDGTICQRAGYDQETGYALLSRERFPKVPEHPTRDDARAALALLVDLFFDFPFVSEAARYVPVANTLTSFARPYIADHNTPIFAYDAHTPGTGKTLAVDVACTISTGRYAPKTPYPTESSELEKLLAATAREAAPILSFDNVSGAFGGGHLDLAVTCRGAYKGRILGVTQTFLSAWRTIITVTGNNLSMKGDTPRRALVSRQDTNMERPETREGFKYPNLLGWVEENRGVLIVAALTILRAYCEAGQPAQPGVWAVGSFERWAPLVAGAIVWAGGANVLETLGAVPEQENPERGAHRTMLALWPELCSRYNTPAMTAKAVLEKLYPVRNFREPPPELDGLDDLREAIETLCPPVPGRSPTSVQLGLKLRELHGRVVGAQCFRKLSGHAGTPKWLVAAPDPMRKPGGAVMPGGVVSGGGGGGKEGLPKSREENGMVELGATTGDAAILAERVDHTPITPTTPTTPPSNGLVWEDA